MIIPKRKRISGIREGKNKHMNKEDILENINKIFIEVLRDKSIILDERTSATDLSGWDSLAHIQLVTAIEKLFEIRFTAGEIRKWKNIGEIVDSVKVRLLKNTQSTSNI